MKIKVSAATTKQLDWMVCRALHPKADMSATHVWLDTGAGEDDFLINKYSTDWSQGGPIVDRFIHAFDHMQSDRVAAIIKRKDMRNGGFNHAYGPTPLIAATRCFVASELGDVVEIPNELLD